MGAEFQLHKLDKRMSEPNQTEIIKAWANRKGEYVTIFYDGDNVYFNSAKTKLCGEVLESGKVFRRYTADWDGQHSHETPYWIIRYLTQIHREALICEDGDVWPANLYDEDNVAYGGGNRFK